MMYNRSLQQAAEMTARALRQMSVLVRVGISERQIARLAGRLLLAGGADKLAFPVIAALGSGAATPHHVPTSRRARRGDMLVLDMGGVYRGMRADMTRTFFFGPPSEVWRRRYGAVLRAQAVGFAAVRPGVTGASIDAAARQYLASRKLAKYFIHSLGHGVGRAIHQPPWISPRKGTTLLRAGDVITIEPGLYFKNSGGIRIEDECVVTARGARWLAAPPRPIAETIIEQ